MKGSNNQTGAALGTSAALSGALGVSEEAIFDYVYTLLGDVAVLIRQSRRFHFEQN